MLDLISLGAIALHLNFSDIFLFDFQLTTPNHNSATGDNLNWQQAKGEPYQSPYEREATGDNGDTETDVEEIRRRSYEQRRQGYEDDYRRDRSREYDNYDDYSRRRRREILEEQKERIEEELEALE
ncbi:MAG: hypothetical protein ACFCU5_06925 [Pleurocapsa sp.]